MNLPLKLKLTDLKTLEKSSGLAILKPSAWKIGNDVVVLSNLPRLCGGTFTGERGFKYAYDFFNLEEKGNSVEKVMKEIYDYAISRFSVMVVVDNNTNFKRIKI